MQKETHKKDMRVMKLWFKKKKVKVLSLYAETEILNLDGIFYYCNVDLKVRVWIEIVYFLQSLSVRKFDCICQCLLIENHILHL